MMLPPPPEVLPNFLELKESQRADCFVASGTDRQGYVVYQNYRGCLNSWLAVPGFPLLPTWGLASELVLLCSCETASHLHGALTGGLQLQSGPDKWCILFLGST